MDKLLLNPMEVATQLGICRSRAYDMIQRGELPGVIHIGRSVRVSAEALREWVRAQIQESSGNKEKEN